MVSTELLPQISHNERIRRHEIHMQNPQEALGRARFEVSSFHSRGRRLVGLEEEPGSPQNLPHPTLSQGCEVQQGDHVSLRMAPRKPLALPALPGAQGSDCPTSRVQPACW